MDEIFIQTPRPSGRYVGVFEKDDETAYFYLYDKNRKENRIVGAIHLGDQGFPFSANQISVRWNNAETVVGVFLGGELWGAFDVNTLKGYGGHYGSAEHPGIPPALRFPNSDDALH